MSKLEEIMAFNQQFVEEKAYSKYVTTKEPSKKMLILSCMDTRLTELLPKAMNIKNGDAKIVKNAGAAVMHPFGSIVRSIIVAIYEFEVEDVFVVGHHCCGMSNLDSSDLLGKITQKGISPEVINTLMHAGIDIKTWLHGFGSVEEAVMESVTMIKEHPLVPKQIRVHGLIMSPETGALEVVCSGDSE